MNLDGPGVYLIRNLVNGKKYVGSSALLRRRWKVHKTNLNCGRHHNRPLTAAWKKYGAENFVFEVLENCPVDHVIAREQWWMDQEKPEYNVAPAAGSAFGMKHHSGAKTRIKGRKRSAESVALTAAAHRGPKRSEETRSRIAQSRTGKKMPPRSAEHRAKLSAAQRGRMPKPEQMAALQAGRARQVFTEERKAKVAASLRAAYEAGLKSRERPPEYRSKIGRTLAKLTDDQVREIRVLLSEGTTGVTLAKRYSVNTGTISEIKTGKKYVWVT